MYKWASGNDIWALAVLNPVPSEHLDSIPAAVKHVLGECADVFQKPTGQPLSRAYDHHIPLLPNTAPINSRPYPYSPQHKDEIERQVQKLLDEGLIIESASPFVSPKLLVQKKDGSCRFCVDFSTSQ